MPATYMVNTLAMPKGVAAPKTENFQKKLQRNQKWAAAKKESDSKSRLIAKKVRAELKKRTICNERNSRRREKQLIKLKREAKLKGGFYVEAEPKVLFVIRIKGVNKLPPRVRLILRLFRLRQIHNGVFLKVNKATMEMLKIVQPFVTYGVPNKSTIRKLIYKRGYAKVGEMGKTQRIKLQDNTHIEQALGKYNIHGIEDIVFEIYKCGPKFKQANNFLWAFKLSSPRSGFTCKRHGYNELRGGDWGDRGEKINELIERMI